MTADRDSNRTSSLAWKSLLLLTLASVGLMAQLRPEIQADNYRLRAESAIKEQDYARARGAMEKVLDLQSEHDLEIPEEFYFKYADVLQRSGDPQAALGLILRYLEESGRDGASYNAALKLMDRVEREIAELDAAEAVASLIRVMAFVRIPAGGFQMGSNGEEARSDERPVTSVRISRDFEIGKYEITQVEWSAVMGQNPSSIVCEQCPVTDVSWTDVREFIGILNQAAGPDRLYRLPTEAEWEYAAKAGTTYASDVDAIAWHAGNSVHRPHTVGEKTPNAFGVHDMLGNVWEWVQDRYGNYPGGSVTDPVGPSYGYDRVLRGCCWFSFAHYCRAAIRYFAGPNFRSDNLGFRLARTVQ